MSARWLPPPRPFVAYQKAPASDGDAATVEAFARGIPRCPHIIGRYVEGPGPERPELAKALEKRGSIAAR